MAALTTARDQLILQRENARLVRRNRDLVEKEYAAGQTSLVRLNEAQRDLIQARGRLALARVSLRQAWQGLYAATGKILDPFEIDGKIDGPADLPESMEGDIVGP
jgi:outer membrane protein TolC